MKTLLGSFTGFLSLVTVLVVAIAAPVVVVLSVLLLGSVENGAHAPPADTAQAGILSDDVAPVSAAQNFTDYELFSEGEGGLGEFVQSASATVTEDATSTAYLVGMGATLFVTDNNTLGGTHMGIVPAAGWQSAVHDVASSEISNGTGPAGLFTAPLAGFIGELAPQGAISDKYVLTKGVVLTAAIVGFVILLTVTSYGGKRSLATFYYNSGEQRLLRRQVVVLNC